MIDDLLLQLPILIKLKVQVPMSFLQHGDITCTIRCRNLHRCIYTQIVPKTNYIALPETNYVPLMQAQISLYAKIGYMYYYEYAHLLKK